MCVESYYFKKLECMTPGGQQAIQPLCPWGLQTLETVSEPLCTKKGMPCDVDDKV